jgi:NAD(P)-dependent dehydrogenase (short-subunit alcohol dehydrogenase family)
MDLQLNGKRALVTGSTAGIGFAIAKALAAEGAAVVINGRAADRVEAALAQLREACPGAELSGVTADLATAQGCAALVAVCPDVDLLVNNLGIFDPKPFEDIPDADWLRFFETNVMSGVRLSRAYLGAMKRRNWGRIVFISSESGLCADPGRRGLLRHAGRRPGPDLRRGGARLLRPRPAHLDPEAFHPAR